MSPARGGLRAAIDAGRFVVTAEIGPPRGADPLAVAAKAELLRGWVDAANVTDNQGAHVRLTSLAGSLLAARAGVEPVMQLTCRDRNRIALQSELIAAGALDVPNVLLLSGDHPVYGDHPDAMGVFDLDSVQLVWTARTLRDEGKLLSGRSVDPAPQWLIGAVENPFAPPLRFRAARLGKKMAAGAEFVQTQFVFDLPMFERWMVEVRDLGLDRRATVIAGVGPIRSLRALDFLQHRVPGIHVPDEVVRRLRGATDVAAEGMRLCVETIGRLREIAGVGGVHVMAFGHERGVPEILSDAGLGEPVPLEEPAHGGGPPHAAAGADRPAGLRASVNPRRDEPAQGVVDGGPRGADGHAGHGAPASPPRDERAPGGDPHPGAARADGHTEPGPVVAGTEGGTRHAG